MLPHLRGRPLTMERYPAGIGSKGFWQKDVSKGYPSWLQRVEVPKKDGVVHHPLVTDAESLRWIINQNTITPHVWVSRAPDLMHPDVTVFDLDPSRDDPEMLRAACVGLRDLLDELGLPCWIKTTGSKGFHIVTSLDGGTPMDEAAGFAHAVARLLVSKYPKELTLEFHKKDRAGRIFVDTGRNDYSATFAAAYAVRPKAGAPVSAPCTWDEMITGEVGPRTLTLRNVPARVAERGDLWSDMRRRRRSLTSAIVKLRRELAPNADS